MRDDVARSRRNNHDNRISVVIAANNEANTLAGVISGAKKASDDVIVVCSRRSSDGTVKVARACKVTVAQDDGKGKGLAMLKGARLARNSIILFIDADGSHKARDIPRITKPIIEGKADMVVGSRALGGSEELHGSLNKLLRQFFSQCINTIINLRFGSRITDSQNGFRAIRRDVLRKLALESRHTEIETEMTMKCLKRGFRIAEVPSKELRRKWGSSNISLLRDGRRYVLAVLKNLL